MLFGGKGAGIFPVVMAEGIISPIEIDQHPSIGHGFDIEVASFLVSFTSVSPILKGEEEFSTPQGL